MVRTSLLSMDEVQLETSKLTIPSASFSELQVSPCCHLKDGFWPCELLSDAMTSDT